ncbi:MAG: AMP-binding protein [Terriglobia bacterium]
MAEGGLWCLSMQGKPHPNSPRSAKDSAPSSCARRIPRLRDTLSPHASTLPPSLEFHEIFSPAGASAGNQDQPSPGPLEPPVPLSDSSVITIIYTSGTSGDAKGVPLTAGNLSFMLARTKARLDELMQAVPKQGDDRVFHYLPFCFAGSWILLLTSLYRNNALMLSTDLTRLAAEMEMAQPHYFLNVPALLDRMRRGIQDQLGSKGKLIQQVFARAQRASLGQSTAQSRLFDSLGLALARIAIFPKIKRKIGPNLQALICGSAPLAEETQLFFQMIGIPVLQVYGLTETTGICTMDEPFSVTAGRVGPAISGIEMKLGPRDEILVRGPHIFPGYWNRPEATAEIIKEGWLHTGDQGEVDGKGNWRIIGRLKNLIIPTSGHNISPEPIEQLLLRELPEADYVMIVGNGRKFLSSLMSGIIPYERAQLAVDKVNQGLPHYKQIRKFYVVPEPFTVENGLLTSNRKIRRAIIETRYRQAIDELYLDSAKATKE